MNNGKYGKDLKNKAAQLELLIIAMVGATLGSLQIINYVFLNTDAHKSFTQPYRKDTTYVSKRYFFPVIQEKVWPQRKTLGVQTMGAKGNP